MTEDTSKKAVESDAVALSIIVGEKIWKLKVETCPEVSGAKDGEAGPDGKHRRNTPEYLEALSKLPGKDGGKGISVDFAEHFIRCFFTNGKEGD